MDRDTVEEIKRHFGIVAEGLRGDVQAVAEGLALLTDRVGGVDTRLEGVETRLEGVETRLDGLDMRLEAFQQETRREFGETQAMIRLSYSELDRRLRDVEGEVGQLKARLERLESRG
jgi:chromosome segregation ATPase